MNAPRSVHLLCAGEALAEGYRHGGYLALCGEPIDTSSLPGARGPEECDCEVTYCPGCLDVATQRSWEAGVAVGGPPGITVVTGTRPGGAGEQVCPDCQRVPGEDRCALPPMLTAQELVDWVALSRGHAGSVVRYRGEYLDGGAPMPRYLLPELLFDVLLRVGLLTLHQPDQLGLETVSLTDAGQARYDELYRSKRQQQEPAA